MLRTLQILLALQVVAFIVDVFTSGAYGSVWTFIRLAVNAAAYVYVRDQIAQAKERDK